MNIEFSRNGKIDALFEGELPRTREKCLLAHSGTVAGKHDGGLGHRRHSRTDHLFNGRAVQRFFQKPIRRLGGIKQTARLPVVLPGKQYESGKRNGSLCSCR